MSSHAENIPTNTRETTSKGNSRSLRMLILGGTGFIGPHFVRAALEKGHSVSVFNRGISAGHLPTGVEELLGNRESGDLNSIENRDWDAVLDMAVYSPGWVRSLGERLQGRVNHYTVISTGAVYENPGANTSGTDETAPVTEYSGPDDPYSSNPPPLYGEMKLLCEREAENQFPGRTLVLREGAIVGPGDPVGALTYWAARMEHGGEILAVGDPHTRVQMIDVRDLAEWCIRLVEADVTGTFNVIGPSSALTWGEMLKGLTQTSPNPPKIIWVPTSWADPEIAERMAKEEPKLPWSSLLFWPTEAGTPGLMSMKNEKACSHGLTFRPLRVTVTDTLAWYATLTPEQKKEAILGVNGGRCGLEASIADERDICAVWNNSKANP